MASIGGIPQIPLEQLLAAAEPVIQAAIEEDLKQGDPTSEAIDVNDVKLRTVIRAKADGVIAGLPVAKRVFSIVDERIDFTALVQDGCEVLAGEPLAEVLGPCGAVLSAERTALNFLQRMSGIATLTRNYVDLIAMTDTVLLDTRKTGPGLRSLDKYAVRMGGGVNHRQNLAELGMIKDNHIAAAGSIAEAYEQLRLFCPNLPIEIEVKSQDEVDQVLALDPLPERILLDEFQVCDVNRAVRKIKGRMASEASGSISESTIQSLAKTGVDSISVGRLTHSSPALDIAMDSIEESHEMQMNSMREEILEWKKKLGKRLIILGHHYVRDEVLALADVRGDSLQLAQIIAASEAELIILCGVHFMGETASLLAKENQHVYLPAAKAGCYLADCASIDAIRTAWNKLCTINRSEDNILPIAYVNSSAELKAFVGEHGGLTCTSSNAVQVLGWALGKAQHVMFFPDRNLAVNTARQLGLDGTEIAEWGSDLSLDRSSMEQARVIAWPGSCNVHQRFLPWHIEAARERFPEVRVAVHPECKSSVANAADEVGSTSKIIRWISESEAGSVWAVGTENRLIKRLAAEHPDKRIISLADAPPFCRTMSQITLGSLYDMLRRLIQGKEVCETRVPESQAYWAREAVTRMLAL